MASKDFQPALQNLHSCSKSYLTALDAFVKSGSQLADAFAAVFHNTPFSDTATSLQALSRDLSSKVSDASQCVDGDAINIMTRLIESGSKVITEESMLILARAFALLVEMQAQFYQTASQLVSPLAENLIQPQALLIGRDCPKNVKDACGTWISAFMSTHSLRAGERLTLEEYQMLPKLNDGTRENNLVVQMKGKLKSSIELYKKEIRNLSTLNLKMKAGFHDNVYCLSNLLKYSCGAHMHADLLDKIRNNLCIQYSPHLHLEHPHDRRRLDEIKHHLQLEAKQFALRIDGHISKMLNDSNLDFKEKMRAICEVMERQCQPLGFAVNFDLFALHILAESSPDVALIYSQIAVLLVYGAPCIVKTVRKPSSKDNPVLLLELSTSGDRITSSVISLWSLFCGCPQIGEQEEKVGVVEVIFSKEVLLELAVEKRHSSIPTIHLKFTPEQQFICSTTSTLPAQECANNLSVLDIDRMLQNLHVAFERLDPRSTNHEHFGQTRAGPSESGHSKMSTHETQKMEPSSVPIKPQALIGPTVTITSESSPTEEQYKWTSSGVTLSGVSKRQNLASDVEVQDIVDFLSGCPTRAHLTLSHDSGIRSPNDSITPTSGSSSSSSNQSGGWGQSNDCNPVRYGNFNPLFQESDACEPQLKCPPSPSHAWSSQNILYYHQNVAPYYVPVMHPYDTGNEAEFAHYIATNLLGKRAPPAMDASPPHFQGHWSPRPDIHRTWPGREAGDGSRKNSLNNTWSTAHDSASSSDESSNNGENTYSQGLGLSGPNLLASVSRRRHSSDDACDTNRPTEPGTEINRNLLEVVQMDAKCTKTWPPKVIWQQQRAPSPMPQNPAVGSQRNSQPQVVKDTLNVHPPLTPQWSDPISLRQQGWGVVTGSTPVSPAASMTMLQPSQTPASALSPSGLAAQQRRHPKLDRRNAYSHF